MEALKRYRSELLAQHRDVPEFINTVVARVLKPATPVAIRQYAAGDAQAAQQAVTELGLGDVARLFLGGSVQGGVCTWAVESPGTGVLVSFGTKR